MNFHQTTEEIINNATAEQRILWNHVFLRFGEKIGVSQFYYQGIIAGSEFLIYSANKIYLAIGLKATYNAYNSNIGLVTFYDEANAVNGYGNNNFGFWDTTAAGPRFGGNTTNLGPLYFSRMTGAVYNYMTFIGYRVSI